jgi:uncharacterized SAM-binding protein YcdF (DUF218 family)
MGTSRGKSGFGDGSAPGPDTGPVGGERSSGRGRSIRWVLFGILIFYTLVGVYHTQILTTLGRFLVVEHTPTRSDLIVCLSGGNIERGLAAADCYRKGLAPKIFIAPEEPPDSFELLKSRSIEYPRTIDLFVDLVLKLGVPRSAILIGERPSGSTAGEASLVRELLAREGYRSIILVTSPTHSRRSFLTFSKILGSDVRIQMVPSPYSSFNPEDWWKQRKYARGVLWEYQKLVYYYLKELR